MCKDSKSKEEELWCLLPTEGAPLGASGQRDREREQERCKGHRGGFPRQAAGQQRWDQTSPLATGNAQAHQSQAGKLHWEDKPDMARKET